MDGRVFCVGSGVMGSDGFESKKLGGPPSSGGPNRLGQSEYSVGAERDPAIDALSGLGDSAANLVEISGVIKWFDASKGYGFIVPDNGAADVLLHVTALRKDGFGVADEGTRVVCVAVRRVKGLQVLKIISMDGSSVGHQSEWRQPRTRIAAAPAG